MMSFVRRLFRWTNRIFIQGPEPGQNNHFTPGSNSLHTTLTENVKFLQALFNKTPDLVVRTFTYKQMDSQAALVYLSGLVDKNAINNNVLRQLMFHHADTTEGELPVTLGLMSTIATWEQIETSILHGYSVLFVDGLPHAYAMDTQGWPQRAITDSQIEASLKGAHQGFVETDAQNIALIRRYISSTELKIKEYYIGRRARSKVSLLYLEDVALPELLQELENRITGLNVDCILNTGELAEHIEDNSFSLFPQFITTERPDTAASQILQGRICVVLDRSSSVLVAPMNLVSFFQGIDDYSIRWPVATFLRLLRILACFVAAFLPGIYIACISFNHEVIPLDLILSIGEFRAVVPYPPLIEALIMEIMLEMLREAGIRLPAPVGQTVGIVGGIVIGQAAVQAGIVSNLMVVIVASTAVASFILPNYDMASSIRLIRFPMMIIASIFGIVGIVAGYMVLIAHLINLKSLGQSYTSPLAPIRPGDWKDGFVRVPLWKMIMRPQSVRTLQKKKMASKRAEGDDS
ncbi:spore germination protein [Paenibacillus chondroitinus]|uniref:Spore germination protein n=2 Tax=Paenibacillus TaxID=44249 RepID=A0ABU6DJE1_9BACL|nr:MULTISPECIES: spore germination protein [Paenibacillus]MCY9659575.1 spore germination protein [Paenibacillus anseongense]MEB4796971.1 spore germination protein [Paenibacillus chondroitinus]